MSSEVREAVKGRLLKGVEGEVLSKKANGEWNVAFVGGEGGSSIPGRIVLFSPEDQQLVEDAYSAAATASGRRQLRFVVDGEVLWTVEGEPGRFPIVAASKLAVDFPSGGPGRAPGIATLASRKRTPDVVLAPAPPGRPGSTDDEEIDLGESLGSVEGRAELNPAQVLLPNFEGWKRAFGV